MNRLVYLFELDSVRSSPQEIRIAQERLFQEIALQGNFVVLSFNQLTDSFAILDLLKHSQTYKILLSLFRSGAIRVSKYGRIASASQYIQKAIQKCLKEDDDGFIFSCLPVRKTEKELLQMVDDALTYSNLDQLRKAASRARQLADSADTQTARLEYEKQKNRLEFIIHYVRLLLLISVEELANHPAKSLPSPSFHEIADRALGQLNTADNTPLPPDFAPLLSHAAKELRQVQKHIQLYCPERIDQRSTWLELLSGNPVARSFVHTCYNITVLLSIDQASDADLYIGSDASFKSAFTRRLTEGLTVPATSLNKEHPIPWQTAVRLLKNTGKRQIDGPGSWTCRIAAAMGRHFLGTTFYILLFLCIEWGLGQLDNFLQDMHLLPPTLYNLIAILLFGITASLLAKKTNTPDILDSLYALGQGSADCLRLLHFRKNTGEKGNMFSR